MFSSIKTLSKHPVSVALCGLLDSHGKMSNFQIICGVSPSSKLFTGETTKLSGDAMKIKRGKL